MAARLRATRSPSASRLSSQTTAVRVSPTRGQRAVTVKAGEKRCRPACGQRTCRVPGWIRGDVESRQRVTSSCPRRTRACSPPQRWRRVLGTSGWPAHAPPRPSGRRLDRARLDAAAVPHARRARRHRARCRGIADDFARPRGRARRAPARRGRDEHGPRAAAGRDRRWQGNRGARAPRTVGEHGKPSEPRDR